MSRDYAIAADNTAYAFSIPFWWWPSLVYCRSFYFYEFAFSDYFYEFNFYDFHIKNFHKFYYF